MIYYNLVMSLVELKKKDYININANEVLKIMEHSPKDSSIKSIFIVYTLIILTSDTVKAYFYILSPTNF